MRSRMMFGNSDMNPSGSERLSLEMAPIMTTNSEDQDIASDAELRMLSERYKKRKRGNKNLRMIAMVSAAVILFFVAFASIANAANHVKNRTSSLKNGAKIPSHKAFGRMQSKYLSTHRATAHVYKHKKTQAEFLAFIPTDENQDKVFGISFRTKPTSDSGVPHILEHSVLSGSKKYPAKDPFLILMKGSLHTFLNAMTYPDRTVYPVASRNQKDFRNLMSVYLDAVFAPRCITPDGDWVLKQEGWRYEVDENNELSLQGVVFSEMKGVFSDPLSVLDRISNQVLFPDNTYHYDSGGHPISIPTLTQGQFVDFYNKHYHPTNSQSFVSGTVADIEHAMGVMDAYMSKYEYNPQLKKNSMIQYQSKRFNHHSYHNSPYAVQKLDAENGQHILSITWLLNDSRIAPKLFLIFHVLDYLLVGSSSAPLIRRLRDSGLGSSVIGNGLSTGLLQHTFSIGMKGVKAEDIEHLEQLVFGIIQDVVSVGFTQDEIRAAVNSISFMLREVNTGSTPAGVSVFLQALTTWNYDESPLDALDFEDAWNEIVDMVNNGEHESNSKYFVRLLNKYLLENRHRVHMELQPSETLEDELIAQEIQYVKSVQVNLNEAEFKSIKATAQRLQDVQNTVDPPSVVNTIPSLTLGDIDKHGVEYDIIVTENAYGTDTLVTKNIADGNAGIVYVDVGIDISSLLYTNIKMLPFIESMLSQSDTDFHLRAELDALIGMQTGGIDIDLQLLPVNDLEKTSHEASNSRKMRSILFFRGKCLAENTGNLLKLIREVAEHSKPVSQQQAVQILERKISSIEAALSTSGHSYAVSRIHARYNIQAFIDENLYGYNQLNFLKEVLGKAQNNWDFFEKRISRVMDSFNTMYSSTTFINLTGDSNSLQRIDATVEAFTLSLARDESSPKVDPSNDHPWMEKAVSKMKSLGAPIDEGIPIASQVSYVGKGGVFFEEGEKISGANCVPLQHLRKGYLWENVRAKNGAYGVSTSLDNTDGFLSMVSYRDPNLSQTIDVYDNAGVYLSEEIAKKMITKDTIKTAIIGCVGDIDGSALPPRKVGWLAFRRFLSSSTATRRQKWRDEILSTTLADFEDFSTRLKKWKDKSTIVAVAPESSLSTRSWP